MGLLGSRVTLFIPKIGDKFFYVDSEYRVTQQIGTDGKIYGKRIKPVMGKSNDIKVPAAKVMFEVESDVKKTNKLII